MALPSANANIQFVAASQHLQPGPELFRIKRPMLNWIDR